MANRKTDEEFKKEVYDLVGDEYTFLSFYVNSKVKLKVKHNKCGNVYKVSPNSFLRGHRCPYCNGNAKKGDEQFRQEVKKLVGNDYIFLDNYRGNRFKLKIKHNKCGHTYTVAPYSFLSGKRCPYCAGNVKKTDAQFKQGVKNIVGDEYTFLDPYQGTHTKLRIKHNKCEHTYSVRPDDFFKGSRCPYCAGLAKKTNNDIKKGVYDIVGDEYTFLDTYVNSETKIRVKHNRCGHIYRVTPHNFFSGNRCPYCAKLSCISKLTKTDEQFKKEVYDLVGGEYAFLDQYVDSKTKLKVKHNKCGNVYGVRPTDFFSHHSRCPYCSNPKGEYLINKILESLGIKYEYQKTFADLKDTQPLSYDFYIPDQNILIEYQGIQHYEPINLWGGEAKFRYQQKHDKMKSNYAKDHGYNLIAIPYTEDTFSKIKKYLLQHGLSK